MNCENKIYNYNQQSYYKRNFCCCKSCGNEVLKENLYKFEKVNENTYKCKICNDEIININLLNHINSMKHLVLEICKI